MKFSERERRGKANRWKAPSQLDMPSFTLSIRRGFETFTTFPLHSLFGSSQVTRRNKKKKLFCSYLFCFLLHFSPFGFNFMHNLAEPKRMMSNISSEKKMNLSTGCHCLRTFISDKKPRREVEQKLAQPQSSKVSINWWKTFFFSLSVTRRITSQLGNCKLGHDTIWCRLSSINPSSTITIMPRGNYRET